MDKRWDVLGFGAVAVDELVMVERHPEPDSKNHVLAHRREGGGLTGTALVAVARLGGRAAYCGVLGDDELARYTLQELEREGVDCGQVLRQAGAQPIHSFIIVVPSTGERTVLAYRGNTVVRPPGTLTADLIAGCRVLFVDHVGLEPALHAAPLARSLGIPVVADLESDSDSRVMELMAHVDHLVLGAGFAERLTGQAAPADAVRALGGPQRACVAVTHGGKGCWYAERGGLVRHIPALAVEARDTTGCGDVFHGAYALCMARGLSVEEAIRVATVTAGLKAMQPGGRTGIPDWETVQRALAQGGLP